MEQKKLRIFFNSNAMWSTSGYGQAIADLLPRIRDDGYAVAISNFYGQAGNAFMMDGIKQYPIINHVFGSDAMRYHSRDFKADVVFSLQDIWPLNPQDLQDIPRWIPWVPIDHDPVQEGIIQPLRFANRVITMSKFGQKQLANRGITSTYIPHTVDTSVFYPMHKIEQKQKIGMPPDLFVVGMVGANKDNPPRKGFQQALDAFKLFLERVPKALLYIHTDTDFPGGFPIHDYARFIGIENQVGFPSRGFPAMYNFKYNTGKKEMNGVYNVFDMLIAPSTSEGFNVPVIEAQACGVPVVVNNWCSMPELVVPGVTGEVCDYSCKIWSHLQSYTAIANHHSLFDKMMKVYQMDKGKASKESRRWVENNFSFEKHYKESWSPFFKRLEKEVYGSVIDKKVQTSNNTI